MKIVVLTLLPILAIAQSQEPVAVTVVSPRGTTESLDQTETIMVTFNQPMVPLRATPVDEEDGPIRIDPPVPGRFRWMGSSTVVFQPSEPMPYGTPYSVHVPKETRSLSGSSLNSDYGWSFETPRPKVLRFSPGPGQQFVEPSSSIFVTFDQPMDPYVVIRSSEVRVRTPGRSTVVDCSAERGDTTDGHSVRLIPAQPFPKGADVTVTIAEGVRGRQGPLGMKESVASSFRVYGNLEFLGVHDSGSVDPRYGLTLTFSNPVEVQTVAERLSFNPELTPQTELGSYSWSSPRVYLAYDLEAEQSYTGTLRAGVKDRFGNTLDRDQTFTFTTGSYEPAVTMRQGFGLIESEEKHRFAFQTVNVDSVTARIGSIDTASIVPVVSSMRIWNEWNVQDEDSRLGEMFTITRTIRPPAQRNTILSNVLNLDAALDGHSSGVVAVQIETGLRSPRFLKGLYQVTRFGVTGKFSAVSTLLWVTTLKEATPVAGAQVVLRSDSNTVLWRGVTNTDGIVNAPGWAAFGLSGRNKWSKPRLWAVVTKGDDIAFTTSDWSDGIEPWQFGMMTDWNPKGETHQATLFTDRGLYKEGESVMIKAIVRSRRAGEWTIPKDLPLQVIVTDSRGEKVDTVQPSLSEYGAFDFTLTIKPNAPTGYYTIMLRNGTPGKGEDQWSNLASQTFRVEAFRAAEFEVTVTPSVEEAIPGDSVTGHFSARYLFGSPMKGEKIDWRISSSLAYWRPEGFDGFWFRELGWLRDYTGAGTGLLASGSGTLDDMGMFSMAHASVVGAVRGPSRLLFEGTVTSPSRQLISGRASALVHAGEYYPGVGVSTTFIRKDSLLTVKLLAVTPGSEIVSGKRLEMKVIRRIWRSVRKAETGGRYGWVTEVDDTPVDSTVVTSGSKAIPHGFTPTKPGFYYIDVRSQDDRGNALIAQAYFYCTGDGYVPWERRDDDRIELVTDKSEYAPGDVASVMVKSPYESALALVTVEREGIMSHFTRTIEGSAATITLPIRPEHVPNAYVSVVLVQGRVDTAAVTAESDVGRPSFKVGYAALDVNPKERALEVVTTTDRTEYRPGDTVAVTIRVTDSRKRGVRSEVALSAADVGVLSLINYALPDPFTVFWATRALGVTTTETRMHLIEQRNYGEKGEDPGGGGMASRMMVAESETGLRKDFRPSAYWNPSIMTDRNGTATVRFVLPDNLTAFRIMAVAHTKTSEFGTGSTDITVSKPLQVQPAFPRFARLGDVFEGGVVLFNRASKPRRVTLIGSASNVAFSGPDTSAHLLQPGKGEEIRFAYTANAVGTATFRFRATTEDDADGIQWKIPVHVQRPTETVVLTGSLEEESTQEAVEIPKQLVGDFGSLDLTAAATSLSDLSGGISYLFNYPYGCLEQRLSSILPIVLAEDLVKAFGFEVLRDKDHRAVVERTLAEAYQFQQPNGGFTYWRGSDRTWAYLSAYAMLGLVKAEQAGYPVDNNVVVRGLGYLRRSLQDPGRDLQGSAAIGDVTQSIILYVLALKRQADFGYMDRLYTRREALPLLARAYLLRAYAAAKGRPAIMEELAQSLINMAKIAPGSVHFEERDPETFHWIWNSHARTSSIVLQALLESGRRTSLYPRVVRWLLDERKDGRWRSTQENVHAVEALATYFNAYEKEEPDFHAEIRIAGGTALSHVFKGRTFDIDAATIPTRDLQAGVRYPLDILKDGDGRLFYTARLTYTPGEPGRQREEGLTVFKEMEPVGATADGNDFEAGTTIRVTLTVVSNQMRNFVSVSDPLPAGFEAVNTSFVTTPLPVETEAGVGFGRRTRSRGGFRGWWYRNPFNHVEQRDDRVLLFADELPPGVHTYTYLARATSYGTFSLPPTRAEGMYEPEVFGQTGERTITVR